MSDVLQDSEPNRCSGDASQITLDAYAAKAAELGGGLKIRRALPVRGKRMIGAWCFLDHFGPLAFGTRKAMDVAPHPHIGLQTVTWLLSGEILHKDSLGYELVIRPGQLNIMTAGKGITHSEETPPEHSGEIHGVQLWIALPEAERRREPDFAHHPDLPVVEKPGQRIHLFLGEGFGVHSPAKIYSPMIGADITLEPGNHRLDFNPTFEHAIVMVKGSCRVEGRSAETGHLYDLGLGRDHIAIEASEDARFVLVGGKPFGEEIMMWWNFVARTHEEIATARADWEAEQHFGPVNAYDGGRLSAPELVNRLR